MISSFRFPFSLVQKILEHVITVVPEAGLQVLPMATVLACNLVKASSDFEAAKENGQSAVVFIAKLSKIIAAEFKVPGASKDLKSWKDLPLIPVKEEIKKPSEYVLGRKEKTEKKQLMYSSRAEVKIVSIFQNYSCNGLLAVIVHHLQVHILGRKQM